MKILCLYHNTCALTLFDWLKKRGNETVLWSERLTKSWCERQNFDLAVSYTYRYIVPEEVLQILDFNAVNLHNSFLPWNRGANPNLWSIADRTPRGVTLHYMESGLDKGAIIAQRLVPLKPGDTLRTSYDELDQVAQEQFKEAFQWYPYWKQMKKYPEGKGTYHSIQSGIDFRHIIDTYDMTAEEFRQRLQQGE